MRYFETGAMDSAAAVTGATLALAVDGGGANEYDNDSTISAVEINLEAGDATTGHFLQIVFPTGVVLSSPTLVSQTAGTTDDFDLSIALSSPNRMFAFPTMVFTETAIDGTANGIANTNGQLVSIGGVTTRDATYSNSVATNAQNRGLTTGPADGTCEASRVNVDWDTLNLGNQTL